MFANTGRECFSSMKRVLLHSCVSVLWCGWGNLYLVSALACLKMLKKNLLDFLYNAFIPLQDAKNLNKSLSIYEGRYQAKEGLTELLFTCLVCLKPFMWVIFLNSVVHVLWEWLAGCTGYVKCLQIKKQVIILKSFVKELLWDLAQADRSPLHLGLEAQCVLCCSCSVWEGTKAGVPSVPPLLPGIST